MQTHSLHPSFTTGAEASASGPGAWRLSIPAGPKGAYRLAQVDDTFGLARRAFHWQAPFALELRARVSAADLPGTWGFGAWNDPFSAGLGVGGTSARLPALPNAAWFFYASPPNHLAFHDGHPAQGFLAATFSAPRVPSALTIFGLPGMPMLALPASARLVRGLLARMLREDAAQLDLDVTAWHTYRMEWQEKSCRFEVDGRMVYETVVAPRGPLGLVIWVDNQYAALPPDGRLGYGTLPNLLPAWVEIEDLEVNYQ
jgi:hypothetical protein